MATSWRECVITDLTYTLFPGDLFPFFGDNSSPSNPVFSYTPLPWAEPYVPLPLLPFFPPLPNCLMSPRTDSHLLHASRTQRNKSRAQGFLA